MERHKVVTWGLKPTSMKHLPNALPSAERDAFYEHVMLYPPITIILAQYLSKDLGWIIYADISDTGRWKRCIMRFDKVKYEEIAPMTELSFALCCARAVKDFGNQISQDLWIEALETIRKHFALADGDPKCLLDFCKKKKESVHKAYRSRSDIEFERYSSALYNARVAWPSLIFSALAESTMDDIDSCTVDESDSDSQMDLDDISIQNFSQFLIRNSEKTFDKAYPEVVDDFMQELSETELFRSKMELEFITWVERLSGFFNADEKVLGDGERLLPLIVALISAVPMIRVPVNDADQLLNMERFRKRLESVPGVLDTQFPKRGIRMPPALYEAMLDAILKFHENPVHAISMFQPRPFNELFDWVRFAESGGTESHDHFLQEADWAYHQRIIYLTRLEFASEQMELMSSEGRNDLRNEPLRITDVLPETSGPGLLTVQISDPNQYLREGGILSLDVPRSRKFFEDLRGRTGCDLDGWIAFWGNFSQLVMVVEKKDDAFVSTKDSVIVEVKQGGLMFNGFWTLLCFAKSRRLREGQLADLRRAGTPEGVEEYMTKYFCQYKPWFSITPVDDSMAGIVLRGRKITAINQISQRENNRKSTIWRLLSETQFYAENASKSISEPFSGRKVKNDLGLPVSNVQLQGISNAMNTVVTMILGPPGCGKTHVSVSVILSWLLLGKRTGKIMVITPSNVAIKHLYDRLMDAVRGRGEFSGIKIKLVLADEFHSLSPQKKTQYRKEAQQARVLLGTTMHASTYLQKKAQSILVDECAQALETDLLVVLGKCTERLVLVGDVYQLPPVIKNESALSAPGARNLMHESYVERRRQKLFDQGRSTALHSKFVGSDVSLMERWNAACPEKTVLLDEQRRMHISIAMWPLQVFYGGRVYTKEERNRRLVYNDMTGVKFGLPYIRGLSFSNPLIRIQGVHVVGTESKNGGGSSFNLTEVKVIVDIVEHLKKMNNVGKENRGLFNIGIITPYKAQATELCLSLGLPPPFLRSNIKGKYRAESEEQVDSIVEVSTVDGFQGKEKDVVILSMCRSNEFGRLGFCPNPKRMNVMLTRSRHILIVVMNQKTFSKPRVVSGINLNVIWNLWVSWMKSNGGWVNATKNFLVRDSGRANLDMGRRVFLNVKSPEMTLGEAAAQIEANPFSYEDFICPPDSKYDPWDREDTEALLNFDLES